MSFISLILPAVYDKVYSLNMKLNYSGPKFYTGGVNIKEWSKLTRQQQKDALAKDWYVYFSYRDPKTKTLVRQTAIKAGVNRFKTKRERLTFMKVVKRSLIKYLELGFVPKEDNNQILSKISGSKGVSEKLTKVEFKEEKTTQKTVKKTKTLLSPPTTPPSTPHTPPPPTPLTAPPTPTSPILEEKYMTIKEAFDFALKIKKRTLSPNSYSGYLNPTRQFQKWLEENKIYDIRAIQKKTVVKYLNTVLERTSARTRNNARTTLSAIFSTLEDNEIIEDNFILKINILPTKPERNKTLTPTQESQLETFMSENDPLLLSFIQFVSYCFLRPVEVCRLRIKDIDVADKKLYVKAKNKKVKIKIIPEILIDLLPDLSDFNPDHFLFTPYGMGGKWNIPERDKRNYFSRRFKKVKDHFKLGKEYGLYSYRHTYITKLYREMRKELTPNETKSKLLGITGHTTIEALEKYLRDIDAELPADYSGFLQPSITNNTQND
ncbi:site-specific integrase [Maribacter sp. MMG018]|uniref:tyrosine-type recombinase/integrase n=1 Tax=Maribacter sp. MMG018 TaxID=2822688 RepID=UPI001B37A18C|nr:site-specific integrase [Maribacter sp. MMG018]MBQ4915270.1 site-specific integrase [Maribacter sp. MMG018]